MSSNSPWHGPLLSRSLRGLIAVVSLAASVLAAAEEIKLSECPPEVQATIREHVKARKIDEIHRIEIEGHTLYLVEYDVKGFKDGKLHVTGAGVLRKCVEEIRPGELPDAVRVALEPYLEGRAHIDDAERIVSEGRTRYYVEIERPRLPDRRLVFESDGTIYSSK